MFSVCYLLLLFCLYIASILLLLAFVSVCACNNCFRIALENLCCQLVLHLRQFSKHLSGSFHKQIVHIMITNYVYV
jgi:hypothetical protein